MAWKLALNVAEQCAKAGVRVKVLSVPTVKPLNTELLAQAFGEQLAHAAQPAVGCVDALVLVQPEVLAAAVGVGDDERLVRLVAPCSQLDLEVHVLKI